MRPLPSLLTVALLLACGASRAAAEDAPTTRLPVPDDLRVTGEESWYGIYFGTTKIGWALKQVGPLEKGGVTVLRSRHVLFIRTQSDGKIKTTRTEQRRIYDLGPPHALRGASSLTRRDDFVRRIVVRNEGGTLSAEITEAEDKRRLAIPGPVPTFADETTPAAWLRGNRRVGETLRHRTLDLTKLRVGVSELRITALENAPGRYAGELVSAAGDRDRVRYDARGVMLATKMMGVMEVRREPRATAQRLDDALDPSEQGEAKIDRGIGQAEYVRGLIVRVRGTGADRVRSGPGQTAVYDPATRALTLRIGAKLTPPVKAEAKEIGEALEESAVYPIHHRVVQALAKETIAKATSTREQVDALVDFVKEFVIDSHTTDPLTALDILADQRGDCNEHALLFATLARAAGIPAREVYGLIYKDDNKRVFGRHTWNEVVIDGVWVPVDPMWGEMDLSAAHIRLGVKDAGPDLRLALAGAQMELVSVQRDPVPGDARGGN